MVRVQLSTRVSIVTTGDSNYKGAYMTHSTHTGHDHTHGEHCGHTAIEHNGHIDYLHDGHLHNSHGDHYDEHALEVNAKNPDTCEPVKDAGAHQHNADEAVPHGDHVDYLHAGTLHHLHGDHCDNHGPVTMH